MLTIETAKAYVANYFEKADIVAPAMDAVATAFDGVPMVEVRFDLDGRKECFSVWVEGGKLYGEW